MSYTSQPTNQRSMNGIITFDDGAGSLIENGKITSDDALISGQTTVKKLDVTYNLQLDGTLSVNSKAITPVWLSYLENCADNIQYQIDNISGSITSSIFSGNNTWSGTNSYSNDVTFNDQTTFNSSVTGLTKSMVGLSNCDNTSDLNKPVSTDTQTSLNTKQDTIDTSNRLNANLISTGVVSNTEFDYLYGVTSAIQTQINTINSSIGSFASLSTANTWSALQTFANNISIPVGSRVEIVGSTASNTPPSFGTESTWIYTRGGTSYGMATTFMNCFSNLTSGAYAFVFSKRTSSGSILNLMSVYNDGSVDIAGNFYTPLMCECTDLSFKRSIGYLHEPTGNTNYSALTLPTITFITGAGYSIQLPQMYQPGLTWTCMLHGSYACYITVAGGGLLWYNGGTHSSFIFQNFNKKKTFFVDSSNQWTILED